MRLEDVESGLRAADAKVEAVRTEVLAKVGAADVRVGAVDAPLMDVVKFAGEDTHEGCGKSSEPGFASTPKTAYECYLDT